MTPRIVLINSPLNRFGEPNEALSDDIEGSDYYSRIAEFSRGGTSMATKRAMGAQHALREAARTSREHIKISVMYGTPQTEGVDESERVAREIARMGGGRFQPVRAIEHLPIKALESIVREGYPWCGVGSWELGVGSWELGVGSWETSTTSISSTC